MNLPREKIENLNLETKNINFKIQIGIYQTFSVSSEKIYHFFFQNFAKLPRSTLAHLGFWCSMYVNVFLLNYNYIINLEIELDTSTCMFLNQPSL